jgi:hypothetical protein
MRKENILIAKFMGVYSDKNGYDYSKIGNKGINYETSWDWLMPVIEKIEKSTVNSCINGITTMIGLSLDHTFYCYIAFNKVHLECKGVNKLDATYKTVLKFIEWYNKQ